MSIRIPNKLYNVKLLYWLNKFKFFYWSDNENQNNIIYHIGQINYKFFYWSDL